MSLNKAKTTDDNIVVGTIPSFNGAMKEALGVGAVGSQLDINNPLSMNEQRDAVNVIDNREKKLKFIAIGGGGRAICEAIKPTLEKNAFVTVEMEWVHIDTSFADDNGDESFKSIIIGDGNGSGGIRATKYKEALEQEEDLRAIFNELNTTYIIVGGTSGGSSLLIPIIVPYSRGFSTILMLADNYSGDNHGENTLKGYMSLFNQTSNGSLFVYSVDNAGRTYEEANKEFIMFINGFALFYSDVVSIDQNDMKYLLMDDQLDPEDRNKLYRVCIGGASIDGTDVYNLRELVIDGVRDGQMSRIDGVSRKQGMSRNPVTIYGDLHKISLYVKSNSFDAPIEALKLSIETRKIHKVSKAQISFVDKSSVVL